MSISLCMIIKDEESVLEEFLLNVKDFVDEIIIVDTGSSDKSKEIAKKYGKVFDFKWEDDFAAARNFSISKATKDWILWLDPDEVVIGIEKIEKLTENSSYLGYRFVQETMINGKKYIQGICKLFQNNKGISFSYPVHESVLPSIKELGGKVGKSGLVIKHNSQYDLKKAQYYLDLIEKKTQNWPESSVDKEKEFMNSIIESFLNQV